MEKFLSTYKILNGENLHQLKNIYTEDVRFIDPAHEINGLNNLTDYFQNMYRNIHEIDFEFIHHLHSEKEGYVQWIMRFSHPKLNRSKDIKVAGASYLRFSESGKVCFHQDYFDLGAMLYEQIPFLGKMINALRRRLGS